MVTTKYGWAVQHPEHLTLGEHVDIGYGTYINARFGVRIGDDVEIGGGCHIYSHNTIEDHAGPIVLEDGCMIGAHCVIFPGVTIGKDAVVGAMSLVNRDVAAGSTVVGVPARKMKRE
ncbi:acyltransferase [bacterium]|nr:acyltransferase [bacterium]